VNEYLRKGRQVLVEGRLNPDDNGNPRVWTGNDGQARASFEVTAQTVRFLGGRGEGGDFGPGEDFAPSGPPSEDEIPF
jgi:single-stranded DNA-binding protein